MTAYVATPLSAYDQDSPITQPLMSAMLLNPVAITEGASGAPRILDAALGTTATAAGRDWVAARIALAVASGVGTFAFAGTNNSASGLSFGATMAGSNLYPTGVNDGGPASSGSAYPGTWMCLGYKPARVTNNASNYEATLWLRVS